MCVQVLDRIHVMLKDGDLVGRDGPLTLPAACGPAGMPLYVDLLGHGGLPSCGGGGGDDQYSLHIL